MMTRLNSQNLIHSNAPARAAPDCRKSTAAIEAEIAHVRHSLGFHEAAAQRGGGWGVYHEGKAKDCRKQIAALTQQLVGHQGE